MASAPAADGPPQVTQPLPAAAPSRSSSSSAGRDGDDPAPLCVRGANIPLLITICGVGDATYMSLSPFYPQVARRIGISTTTTGVIFSCFMWGGIFFSPLATRLSRTTSPRLLLSTSVLAQAALTACFALAPLLSNREQFFALCFGVRIVQGCVCTVYEVAVSSLIMCSTQPERVGALLGLQEAARGVGLMVGPAVGGLLFAVGGFALPFVASAAALLLLGLAVLTVLEPGSGSASENTAEHATILEIVRQPPIAVTTALLIALAMALSVLDPILAPHVEDTFHLQPSSIGLIFASATISYALCSPLVGPIGNRVGNFAVLVVGCIISALALFALGPTTWLPAGWLPRRVWLLAASMVVLGIGASALTCAVPCMLEIARRRGYEIEAVSDVVGGLLSFAWSVGAVVGPLYGSALYEAAGFANAMSATAVMLLVLTALGVLVFNCTGVPACGPIYVEGGSDQASDAPTAAPSAEPAEPGSGRRRGEDGMGAGARARTTQRPWWAPWRSSKWRRRRDAAAEACLPAALSEPLLDPIATDVSGDERDDEEGADPEAAARRRPSPPRPHSHQRL